MSTFFARSGRRRAPHVLPYVDGQLSIDSLSSICAYDTPKSTVLLYFDVRYLESSARAEHHHIVYRYPQRLFYVETLDINGKTFFKKLNVPNRSYDQGCGLQIDVLRDIKQNAVGSQLDLLWAPFDPQGLHRQDMAS